MTDATQQSANRRTVTKLVIAACIMFGFGYALVPLYDVFCDITGLNGKTGRVSAADAAATRIDEQRLVTVEFVTSLDPGMPWEFKPVVNKVAVHPGAETQVEFQVTNLAQYPITGNAVPSVAPNKAARYFNKTECFCFTQQSLAAGESRTMPVRFVVDPRLPPNVDILTLGYTFFESTTVSAAPAAAAGPQS